MKWMILLLFLPCVAMAGEDDVVPSDFDTYWLVLLNRGETRSQNEEEAQKIQTGHLGHLHKLRTEGKIYVAGPLEVDADYKTRGLVLYPTTMTREEVTALASADPAVKAGRLSVEVIKWWVPKGAFTFAKP